MLTFNAILRHEGLDPAGIRLARHQDTRRPGRPTAYQLWRADDGTPQQPTAHDLDVSDMNFYTMTFITTGDSRITRAI
jgi:hypothetical protein